MEIYLAGIPSEAARRSLEKLRDIIKSEVPEARETFSYGMPGFKLDKNTIWFAAFKNHCSLFPGSDIAPFLDRLTGFKTSKGTIQFQPDNPLPEPLVREIVRLRLKPHR